ncbi:MAG: glycosyltransferase [Acidobacteriota bacterium]
MSSTILHLNTERSWRGGEAQTLMLARGLARRGHRCLVVGQPRSPLVERAAESGLGVYPIMMRGDLHLGAARRIGEIIRAESVGLLHYHTAHAVSLGTLATFFSGRRPAVASRRLSIPLRNRLLGRLKYGYRVDRVIAVSEAIRRNLLARGFDPRRVEVVHSGIELDRFTGASHGRFRASLGGEGAGIGSGTFLFGTAGHFAGEKGFDLFIEAAALAARELPQARFVLVGRGEKESALRDLAVRRGVQENVLFAGFRDEMPEVFEGLDLFVLPSPLGEGSPAVVKEAMAAGVPLVATDLDGIEELTEDGRHAVLVPPGDAPAMARAMVLLAGDPPLRKRLVAAARQQVRKFAAERMVEKTEAIYRSLGIAP